jgi:hypothetical protein
LAEAGVLVEILVMLRVALVEVKFFMSGYK